MKKENFVTLVMGIIGGLIFALGMCMCLIPEWNAFTPGVIMSVIGAVILIAMLLVRRKMEGKEPIRINGKTIGIIALALVGVVIFGVGMCMVMVWEKMALGIIIGIVGIVLLLCLIPLCKGLK